MSHTFAERIAALKLMDVLADERIPIPHPQSVEDPSLDSTGWDRLNPADLALTAAYWSWVTAYSAVNAFASEATNLGKSLPDRILKKIQVARENAREALRANRERPRPGGKASRARRRAERKAAKQ